MNNEKRRGRRPLPANPVTCSRIEKLRGREARKEAAEGIGIGEASLARYEKGERGVPDSVLELMARYWKVLPEYLKGETDIKDDPIAFKHEQDQKVLDGFSKAVEKNEYDIRRTRLEILFSLCGFHYNDTFAGELRHTIVDETGLVSPATFGDGEMETILSKIHDLIELECFRKTCEQGNKKDALPD